jgi:hypothetical protein
MSGAAWWGEAHPVRVLRRLRDGVLVTIAVLALLGAATAAEAIIKIKVSNATCLSIGHIQAARQAAGTAADDLRHTFDARDVSLTGTGTGFVNAMGNANLHIASAAPGIAPDKESAARFQFVLGQVATSVHLAEIATQQYADFKDDHLQRQADDSALKAMTAPNERDGHTYLANTGGLIPALGDLSRHQTAAFSRQHPVLLAPAVLWPLLLVPVLALLLAVGATAQVLARHFRRLISPLLGAALCVATAVPVVSGVLGQALYRRATVCSLPRSGGLPVPTSALVPLAVALLMLFLLAVAGTLAYYGYRPRLAEYAFGAS